MERTFENCGEPGRPKRPRIYDLGPLVVKTDQSLIYVVARMTLNWRPGSLVILKRQE